MTQFSPQAATASEPASPPPAILPDATEDDAAPPQDVGEDERAEGADADAGTDQAPEPAPWAGAPDLEALENVPEVRTWLEERETAARDAGRSDAHGRLQPKLEELNRGVAQLNQFTSTYREEWNQFLEDAAETLTPEQYKGLSRTLSRNKEQIAALAGVQLEEGMWDGITQIIQRTGEALADPAFTREFVGRIANMRRNLADATFMEDLVDRIAEPKVAKMRAELKEANAEIARRDGDERRHKRDGQPPPATAPVGRSGNLTGAQIIERYNANQMSQAEFNEHVKAGRVDLSFKE